MQGSESAKPLILIVDDSKVIRLAARKMLAKDYTIELAEDGEQAWLYLQQHADVAVVFSDLSMPRMDGMTLLKCIREADDEALSNLPVVVLTGAEDDETVKQRAMDAGATDFILKPFDSIDLISRAKSCAELSSKQVELEENAAHDRLTGVYTAKALQDLGTKAISFAHRHQLFVSICVFEIKDIKVYYQKFGKKVVQHILVTVAKRIQAVMREEDVIGRLDLARFALVLTLEDKQKTSILPERIQTTIGKLAFNLGTTHIRLLMQGGVTTAEPGTSYSFEQLLRQAEAALNSLADAKTMQLAYYEDKSSIKNAPADDTVIENLSDAQMEQVLKAILRGEYENLSDQSVLAAAKRLSAFMHFAEQRRAKPAIPLSQHDLKSV